MSKRDTRIYVKITNNASSDSWYEVLSDETLKQAQSRQPGYTVTKVTKKEAAPYFAAEQASENAALSRAENGGGQEYDNDRWVSAMGYDD